MSSFSYALGVLVLVVVLLRQVRVRPCGGCSNPGSRWSSV